MDVKNGPARAEMQNAECKMQNEKCDEGRRERDIQERTLLFASDIVDLYERLQRKKGAARALSNQLLHSGTSVGANLEEAEAAQSKADFICKCRIALKEARETHYWLRVLRRASGGLTEPLISEASQLVAILTTIVKSARNSTKLSKT